MSIQKVGVIGAGTMGNGIAHVFAASGHSVILCDIEHLPPSDHFCQQHVFVDDYRNCHSDKAAAAFCWAALLQSCAGDGAG